MEYPGAIVARHFLPDRAYATYLIKEACPSAEVFPAPDVLTAEHLLQTKDNVKMIVLGRRLYLNNSLRTEGDFRNTQLNVSALADRAVEDFGVMPVRLRETTEIEDLACKTDAIEAGNMDTNQLVDLYRRLLEGGLDGTHAIDASQLRPQPARSPQRRCQTRSLLEPHRRRN